MKNEELRIKNVRMVTMYKNSQKIPFILHSSFLILNSFMFFILFTCVLAGDGVQPAREPIEKNKLTIMGDGNLAPEISRVQSLFAAARWEELIPT